jgi:hypothetical protein
MEFAFVGGVEVAMMHISAPPLKTLRIMAEEKKIP